jgi:hypothetical protein
MAIMVIMVVMVILVRIVIMVFIVIIVVIIIMVISVCLRINSYKRPETISKLDQLVTIQCMAINTHGQKDSRHNTHLRWITGQHKYATL